jgi:hypothetical protein
MRNRISIDTLEMGNEDVRNAEWHVTMHDHVDDEDHENGDADHRIVTLSP